MELDQHVLMGMISNYKNLKNLGDRGLDQIVEEKYITNIKHDEVNSIASLVKHLHGNMLSRWTNFLSEDGEKSWRKRDDEFVSPENMTKDELIMLWEDGWKVTLEAIESLKVGDLMRVVKIYKEDNTVFQALNRQIIHYATHIGQIIHLIKTYQGDKFKSLSIPRKK